MEKEITCAKCKQKITLFYDVIDGKEYDDGEVGHADGCDKFYQSN
jgi:hypothetical protein